MSINNTTRKTAIMNGNGTSVLFPFAFRINDEEDLKVYVKIGVGAYELKELNTDYKLSNLVRDSNNNIISGDIEFPIIIEGEPDQPSPLTSNDFIYGIRQTPKTQQESSEQVSFKSKDVERALDKATMQIQELDETISRAVVVPEFQDIDPEELIEDIYTAAGQASQAAEDASGYANDANTYATNASNSSLDASKWAEGTDSDVQPLGGTHSAKGWAGQSEIYATQAASILSSCADKDLSNLTVTGEAKFNAKVDLDLNNITSSDKILNSLAADFTSSTTIAASNTFTAPSSGWINYSPEGNSGTSSILSQANTGYIQIEGKTIVSSTYVSGSDSAHPDTCWAFIGKGQTCYHTMSAGTVYFYPCKGV